MNAVEMYERASWDLEHNKITLGEFEERIKALYDVEPVRHGHWNFGGLFVDDIYAHGASCSICGEYSEDNGYYCSCCGAKMDDALQRKKNPELFKGGDEG